MLRIAICDDEEYICSKLESCIKSCCLDKNIETETEIYTSGEGFIKNLNADDKYNLIFLDIELGHSSGIDVSEHIRNVMHNEAVQIVYVSGKNGYDRQLFTFRPFHFIDKPFDKEKVAEVIEKYLRIYGNQNEIFHYKIGHDTYWAKLGEILYFKSLDRRVVIRTTDNEDVFYCSLEMVEEQLKGQGFLVPHKSYLVNYRFIRSFQSNTIIMTNGEEIPIAKTKRKEIMKAQLALEIGGEFHVD